jgi:hypothetical protein
MKVKRVKVYAVVMDGFYSHIEIREINKDMLDNEHSFFKSLSGAKKYLLAQLKDMVYQYQLNVKEIKSIKGIDADGNYIRK